MQQRRVCYKMNLHRPLLRHKNPGVTVWTGSFTARLPRLDASHSTHTHTGSQLIPSQKTRRIFEFRGTFYPKAVRNRRAHLYPPSFFFSCEVINGAYVSCLDTARDAVLSTSWERHCRKTIAVNERCAKNKRSVAASEMLQEGTGLSEATGGGAMESHL